jgi:pyruvate dehydrogenase E1 component alpha subunit
MFDPELYRDKAEVERWRKRDPIPAFTQMCLRDGTLTADDVAAIEKAADAEIEDAVAFADAGTWESVEDLERDVLTPAREPVT